MFTFRALPLEGGARPANRGFSHFRVDYECQFTFGDSPTVFNSRYVIAQGVFFIPHHDSVILGLPPPTQYWHMLAEYDIYIKGKDIEPIIITQYEQVTGDKACSP